MVTVVIIIDLFGSLLMRVSQLSACALCLRDGASSYSAAKVAALLRLATRTWPERFDLPTKRWCDPRYRETDHEASLWCLRWPWGTQQLLHLGVAHIHFAVHTDELLLVWWNAVAWASTLVERVRRDNAYIRTSNSQHQHTYSSPRSRHPFRCTWRRSACEICSRAAIPMAPMDSRWGQAVEQVQMHLVAMSIHQIPEATRRFHLDPTKKGMTSSSYFMYDLMVVRLPGTCYQPTHPFDNETMTSGLHQEESN